MIDYYRNNPAALDALRAPIFEDKVVDFILEMAEVADRPAAPAELLAEATGAGTAAASVDIRETPERDVARIEVKM